MTPRMFAFLRAINTGGRRLTTDRLLEPFHAAGLSDVSAYQAAGNVTFRSGLDPETLEVELADLLGAAYGFEVPVFVRTADELRTRMAAPPFTDDELAATEGRTQISFMGSTPSAAEIDDALALVPADDRVVFTDREWWWLPQAGVSDSALPVARIEQIVGPMTMRTVGTVDRLLAKFAT